MLLEQPGAWGRNALRDSRLNATVVAGLLARCHAANARLLLIRRAHRDPTPWRSWAIVDARPGSEATGGARSTTTTSWRRSIPRGPRVSRRRTPVFLVCTHGRRDACCAGRGWPVAVALTEAFPEQTWQCSHVGGDRFAANVVMLPHGLYYGRLTPDDAVAVARRHLEGRVTSSRSAAARASRPPSRRRSTSRVSARPRRDRHAPSRRRRPRRGRSVEVRARPRTTPSRRSSCASTSPSRSPG